MLQTAMRLVFGAIVLIAPAGAGGSGAPPRNALQLWIVLDTSPSTDSVTGELRTVARAAVGALVPGDQLRLISAHRARPRLRALERIGPGGLNATAISAIQDGIRPTLVLKANLAEALKVPFQAARTGSGPPTETAVLVLTDRRLDDTRAQDFLDLVDRLESAGARVICTGTDQAARHPHRPRRSPLTSGPSSARRLIASTRSRGPGGRQWLCR